MTSAADDPLERFFEIFAASADGILVHDADTRIALANPSAARILGERDGTLPGCQLATWVDAGERQRLHGLCQAFAHGSYAEDVDLSVVRSDGRRIVINGSFCPIGTRDLLLFSFRDVTDTRRTATELEKTKTFLESLVNASVDAIVAADMNGTILLFNLGAERIYKRRASEVIGSLHVRALYPPGGAKEVGRMLRSDRYGGVGRLEPTCIEAVDANGHTFPISLSAAWIYEQGRPTASFGIFTDLREKVRVEQQLAQAQQQLEASAKRALVAEVAGATAHELNQPLTSVMGYATLIKRKLEPSSPLHRAADVIFHECQRMADIVRKIGKLTRYETKSYIGAQKILDLDRASEEDALPSGTLEGATRTMTSRRE